MSLALTTVVSCTSKAVPADATLARGQEVFDQNCAVCHGDKGQGKTAPPLVGIAKTFPDVSKQIAVITNGQSTMPAWKGKLSTADIAAVAAYSRTL